MPTPMQTHTYPSSHSQLTATNTTMDMAGAAPVAGDVVGEIIISPRVIFTLALSAALATYGVVGIASRYTGSDCTHTDPRRGLEIRFVHAHEDDQGDGDVDGQPHVIVSIHIIVEYGVRIQAVTSSLQHQVKYRIERSTGYTVDAVQVHVAGLRVTNAM